MITEYKLKCENMEIVIDIIRSHRKSIAIEVRDSDKATVRIPYELRDNDLKDVINEKREWIIEKCRDFMTVEKTRPSTGATAPQMLTPEEIEKIQIKFGEKVRHYCKEMGVTANKITVRNQKTRWGSCSAKKNLSFNYQLYYLPDKLMDYVIIHELAHIRHMDHSKEFWAEVEKYCPDYDERRKELKKYKLA